MESALILPVLTDKGFPFPTLPEAKSPTKKKAAATKKPAPSLTAQLKTAKAELKPAKAELAKLQPAPSLLEYIRAMPRSRYDDTTEALITRLRLRLSNLPQQ